MKRSFYRTLIALLCSVALGIYAAEGTAELNSLPELSGSEVLQKMEEARQHLSIKVVQESTNGIQTTTWQRSRQDGSFDSCSQYKAPEGKSTALEKSVLTQEGLFQVYEDLVVSDQTPTGLALRESRRPLKKKPIFPGTHTAEKILYRGIPCYKVVTTFSPTPEQIQQVKEKFQLDSEEEARNHFFAQTTSIIDGTHFFRYLQEFTLPSGKVLPKIEYLEVVFDPEFPAGIFELPPDRKIVPCTTNEELELQSAEATRRQQLRALNLPQQTEEHHPIECVK